MRMRLVLSLFLLFLVGRSSGSDKPSQAPAKAHPFKPYAVIVFEYDDRNGGDRSFPLTDLVRWIELLHTRLQVDPSRIIVITPRASVLGAGQKLADVLPGIAPTNYLPKGGVCDVLRVLEGKSQVGGLLRMEEDVTHVYFVLAMHGFIGEEFEQTFPAYGTNGGVALPFKSALKLDCPANAPEVPFQESLDNGAYYLYGPQFKWMAEQQPAPRQFIGFIDACMSAGFFQSIMQRLDPHSGAARTEALADAKLALYSRKLLQPRSLFITSAADNCAASSDAFLHNLDFSLDLAVDDNQPWSYVLLMMKDQAKTNVVPAGTKGRASDKDLWQAWHHRKTKPHRLTDKATVRMMQVRAFGDPHMLLEKVDPRSDEPYTEGEAVDFAKELIADKKQPVKVVKDKGLPEPKWVPPKAKVKKDVKK